MSEPIRSLSQDLAVRQIVVVLVALQLDQRPDSIRVFREALKGLKVDVTGDPSGQVAATFDEAVQLGGEILAAAEEIAAVLREAPESSAP